MPALRSERHGVFAGALIFMVGAVLIFAGRGLFADVPDFRRGDADANGLVNVADATMTLRSLFVGDRVLFCDDAADANDDGAVEVSDGIRILLFLYGGQSPLPAPGAEDCGPDPTPDGLLCGDYLPCRQGATVVAERGTPADPLLPSANVGQAIRVEGTNLNETSTVVFPIRNGSGDAGQLGVFVADISPDQSSASVTVPDAAETGLITLPGGSGLFLQIVPFVTGIDGGRGRRTTIFGGGFIEGATTVRFGPEEVVDGGTSHDDGIDVFFAAFQGENRGLSVTVPEGGTLPYEVITEGGRSGRSNDVVNIPTLSDTGTPVTPTEASANVRQTVTMEGAGYVVGETRVTLEAMTSNGVPFITTVDPESISPDGRSLEFVVPDHARTGVASILSGGAGRTLQIVPWVGGIEGGKDRATTIFGSGFTEGYTTVRFGALEVVDGGPRSDDGIDVFFVAFQGENRGLRVSVPPGGTLPYEVSTEGGSSGRGGDVTAIPATAETGTPAMPAEASANVGQSVTILGEGFVDGVTSVTLEALTSAGVPFITTVEPESVAPDSRSLEFIVPDHARTGIASVLSGQGGKPLQIVPRVTAIEGGRGRDTRIFGSGFTEGHVRVRFGAREVVDGGTLPDDGIDVYFVAFQGENRGLWVAAPSDGTLPYEVITEGGASGRLNDVTRIVAVAGDGTPAIPAVASANVEQSVTIEGSGFVEQRTRVTLEAVYGDGVPFITTVEPEFVAADGTWLRFRVPHQARTGIASILSGGSGEMLQIVPTLSTVSSLEPGAMARLRGTGFTEGSTRVTFGAVEVVDGGTSHDDGIDVYFVAFVGENCGLNVTVPGGAAAPVTVSTEGGRSNPVTP